MAEEEEGEKRQNDEEEEEEDQHSAAERLVMAYKSGDKEEIQKIDKSRLMINTYGKTGRSLIYWASYSGLEEEVRALAQLGADVNRKSTSEVAPIFVAAHNGRYKCIEVLARYEKSVEASTVLFSFFFV